MSAPRYKAAAATVLRLDRRTIYRKLRQYGIDSAERATDSLRRSQLAEPKED